MKKNFRTILFTSFLLGGLLLAACSPKGNPLDGTSWEMTSYRDANGDMTEILAGTVVTALFQSADVSGIAGCNNFSSSYQVDGKNLTFSAVTTTRQMCATPIGIMQQEDAFLSDLSQVQSFKISDGQLELEDEKGKTILVFVPIGQ
jgi:heat shock protein HslJ